MSRTTLFDPLAVGRLEAPNRIAMAPMTRSRADAQGVLPEATATYYAQRAGAGLIITEGAQPSFEGQGYARTPGIHTDAQKAAWARVADAVHAAGGRIFMQIMHVGRIAHLLNRQTDAPAVAPSAIAPAGTQMWTDQEGMQPIPVPRALEASEIQGMLDEYAAAAANAVGAGLDGVELHSASGYLPNQFLASNTNHRTDRYGGPPAHRIRFTLEALEAMAGAVGSDRVGIKISPGMGFNDCLDDDPRGLFSILVPELGRLDLAYLHVGKFATDWDVHGVLRPLYDGVYLAGGGLRGRDDGQALLDRGVADMTVWGQRFLANPDLPARLGANGPFNEAVPDTFYTPGETGYTDYPALAG